MKRAFIYPLLLWIMATPNLSVAADLKSISKQFEQQLKQSQQRYQKVADQLKRQRAPQLQQLQKQEQELMQLRQQLAGQTRAQDQQFVSLQTLQQQLGQWQQQNQYIDNLLGRYLGSEADVQSHSAFTARLQQLMQASQPAWRSTELIGIDGRLIQGQQLTIGPLSWFVDQQQQGYLVDTLAQPNHAVIAAPHALNDWQSIPVDISQDQAIRIAANQNTWLMKIEQGGIWVYPIVLLGGLALLIALYKLLMLMRLTKLQPQLAQQALAGELPTGGGWQQQLFELAQAHQHWPHEALADKLHHQLLVWKAQLDSKMGMLVATATVAPLLGLLGTVSGMIQTFDMMKLFGNQDQNMLAGGISEALITTELGLIVAVPTLLVHAYIHRRHQAYLAQLEADTVLLAELSHVKAAIDA